MDPSNERIGRFTAWLASLGPSAGFHPDVALVPVPGGHAVRATRDLPTDTPVVSMPFALAITHKVARAALAGLRPPPRSAEHKEDPFGALSERQAVCAYIALHWILGLAAWEEDSWEALPSTPPLEALARFRHAPYIDMLPAPSALRTPLYFTDAELNAFRGTALHGATLDRRAAGEVEWQNCVDAFHAHLVDGLATRFTWKMYLTAATYLSSRAFPSTLLAPSPSLAPSPVSYPILLPGVDALNHRRGHAVTWAVNSADAHVGGPAITLVVHVPTPAGAEVFNNYGAKPNAELVLGYGFALEDNPEDTVVLRIGGTGTAPGPRWEVGRGAHGADAVYAEVRRRLEAPPPDGDTARAGWEDALDAADALGDMVRAYLERLPRAAPLTARPEVLRMWTAYVKGQREILASMLEFAESKRHDAMEEARAAGVEIVEEEDD